MVEFEKVLERKEKREQHKLAVLEDSEQIAEILKDFLEENGFQVFHSQSGTDNWLENLEKEGVKHFLLDVEQERKPLGFQFAEKVKEKIKDSKIIMMSGNPDHKKEALDKKYDFISKPFRLVELLDTVKKHFEK